MYATNRPKEGSDTAPERLVAELELKKFALIRYRKRRAKLEGRDVRLAEETEHFRDRLRHSRGGSNRWRRRDLVMRGRL